MLEGLARYEASLAQRMAQAQPSATLEKKSCPWGRLKVQIRLLNIEVLSNDCVRPESWTSFVELQAGQKHEVGWEIGHVEELVVEEDVTTKTSSGLGLC